jgi:hypothetical protein
MNHVKPPRDKRRNDTQDVQEVLRQITYYLHTSRVVKKPSARNSLQAARSNRTLAHGTSRLTGSPCNVITCPN